MTGWKSQNACPYASREHHWRRCFHLGIVEAWITDEESSGSYGRNGSWNRRRERSIDPSLLQAA
jgi:hypothetical protein